MKTKIPVANPDLSGNEKKYLLDALLKEKRVSSSGKYVGKFETLGAKNFERKFALSCSNGTVALHLALLSLGIGRGDEVIVPTFTFAATAAVVVHCEATPVFVDSNINDWNVNVDDLARKLTPKTKAVIAVDIYGMPCDYDRLRDLCAKNKIHLVEDAAEAHGARYKNNPVGSFGEISCFSFYGNKVLTTGEGGMCLTDNKKLYEKMKVFKNHGMKESGLYEHDLCGYNYRLTNIQAAVGCAQFERLNKFLRKRKKIESLYKKFLGGTDFISFQTGNQNQNQVCWLFSILIKKDVNKVRENLSLRGIETRRLFKPMHLQKAYQSYASKNQKFPVAEYLYENGITLPTSVDLAERDIKKISDAIKKNI